MLKYENFFKTISLTDDERERFEGWLKAMESVATNENGDIGNVTFRVVFSNLGDSAVEVEADGNPETDMNPFMIRQALDW